MNTIIFFSNISAMRVEENMKLMKAFGMHVISRNGKLLVILTLVVRWTRPPQSSHFAFEFNYALQDLIEHPRFP